MYDEFRYKVNAKYLSPGDLCFHVGADKCDTNLMEMTGKRGAYPWYRFVHPSEWAIRNNQVTGWSFADVLTDHPVYSEGWEYPGDGTRHTKMYLVSEEVSVP